MPVNLRGRSGRRHHAGTSRRRKPASAEREEGRGEHGEPGERDDVDRLGRHCAAPSRTGTASAPSPAAAAAGRTAGDQHRPGDRGSRPARTSRGADADQGGRHPGERPARPAAAPAARRAAAPTSPASPVRRRPRPARRPAPRRGAAGRGPDGDRQAAAEVAAPVHRGGEHSSARPAASSPCARSTERDREGGRPAARGSAPIAAKKRVGRDRRRRSPPTSSASRAFSATMSATESTSEPNTARAAAGRPPSRASRPAAAGRPARPTPDSRADAPAGPGRGGTQPGAHVAPADQRVRGHAPGRATSTADSASGHQRRSTKARVCCAQAIGESQDSALPPLPQHVADAADDRRGGQHGEGSPGRRPGVRGQLGGDRRDRAEHQAGQTDPDAEREGVGGRRTRSRPARRRPAARPPRPPAPTRPSAAVSGARRPTAAGADQLGPPVLLLGAGVPDDEQDRHDRGGEHRGSARPRWRPSRRACSRPGRSPGR